MTRDPIHVIAEAVDPKDPHAPYPQQVARRVLGALQFEYGVTHNEWAEPEDWDNFDHLIPVPARNPG